MKASGKVNSLIRNLGINFMTTGLNAAEEAGLKFRFKSFKKLAIAHDDGTAYRAKLYLNGKLFGDVIDDGWGGPVAIYPAPTISESEFAGVTRAVSATKIRWTDMTDPSAQRFTDIPNSLDTICGELLIEHAHETEYQKVLKKLGFIEDGMVRHYPRMKPTLENIEWMKAQRGWNQGCVAIQEASREDVLIALGVKRKPQTH